MHEQHTTTLVDALVAAPSAATILIADDDPIGREMLAVLLAPQGYRLIYAGDGAEALAQAELLPPDLVLLDAMMPKMDGFEVCRRLRADPLLREVPVIMLTALDDRESRLQAIEAGADDFISKPFDRIELQARVCTITRLNRYRRLLAERAKFARVVELAPDGMLIVDEAGAIVLANSAMVQLLGTQHTSNLLGRYIATFITPEQREQCSAHLRRVTADPATVARFETMLICLGGMRLPVEMHVGSFVWDGQPAAQIVARDITERKQAELLEGERHHIAYELHDGLAQIVTSAHQHLQAFASRYHPRKPQARADLERAMDLAQRAVREVRRVIGGLRPTALDDFGLAAALQMHVAALRADGWEVTYRQTIDEERLPPALETVIFRVAQEALTNVRKHAQTTRAHLELERQGSELRLIIQDWGCGFDISAVPDGVGLGEHIGLRGMRERIALLGGQWSIDSRTGHGTRVVAMIPLSTIDKGDSTDES
ncbi:MAG: response regulator [Roseiflexaceae bacterium]